MRNNQPVTQREVTFDPDSVLVSLTDNSGVIQYANRDFVAISGFSEEELLGANQNIVRHPDMPPLVFKDMWQRIEAGVPSGFMMNSCSSLPQVLSRSQSNAPAGTLSYSSLSVTAFLMPKDFHPSIPS